MVLKKTLESPLNWKNIKPVNLKGNQAWIFIGRTDAEPEVPILWLPDPKNWLKVKDLDAGKGWRWEEKGITEDEMVGWYHRLDGFESEQAAELVMNREAWRAAIHGVAKSQIWLNGWTEWLNNKKANKKSSLLRLFSLLQFSSLSLEILVTEVLKM